MARIELPPYNPHRISPTSAMGTALLVIAFSFFLGYVFGVRTTIASEKAFIVKQITAVTAPADYDLAKELRKYGINVSKVN